MGRKAIVKIDQNVVYRSLEDPEQIYSLLLVVVWILKTLKERTAADGSYLCEAVIPNK